MFDQLTGDEGDGGAHRTLPRPAAVAQRRVGEVLAMVPHRDAATLGGPLCGCRVVAPTVSAVPLATEPAEIRHGSQVAKLVGVHDGADGLDASVAHLEAHHADQPLF